MRVKYDVEYYIKFAEGRINVAVQFKAQLLKLDEEFLKKECLRVAREEANSYVDTYGTQGFMKWFSVIVFRVSTFQANNPRSTREKIEPTYKEVIPEEITKSTEEVVIKPETALKKQKVCTMCQKKKDLEEFYNNKPASDGKSSACKTCLDDRARELKAKKTEIKTRFMNKPQIKHTGTNTKIHKTTPTGFSDASFTNEDIDELITPIKAKLDIAEAEVERLKNLIDKLQRRKK